MNKLAYWSATGSGKTLIMHINILQFKNYTDNKFETSFLLRLMRAYIPTYELTLSSIDIKDLKCRELCRLDP